MQTHTTGPIRGDRQGSVESIQTIPINVVATTTTFVTATAKKILSIKASAAQPVYVEYEVIVQAASNSGSTATLSIGKTSAGYIDILNAVDLKAAADTSYPKRSATYAAPTVQAAATYVAPTAVPIDSVNATNPLTSEFNTALAALRSTDTQLAALAADVVSGRTASASTETQLAALAADVAASTYTRRLYTANTDIYAIVTCSAFGTAGMAYVIVKMTEVNVKKVS